MQKSELIAEVQRLIQKSKNACVVWSASPSGVVRSQIENHFSNAERNIQDLLDQHWPDHPAHE
jgi:hypothetical protein